MFQYLKSAQGLTLDKAYPQIHVPTDGYQINNQYKKFPPLTADGRNIHASWQPGSEVNNAIIRENNIQSNWQYRKYMTANANQLREKLFQDALNDVGYKSRNETSSEAPSFMEYKGLSDLKDNYLTREELQAKMVVPSLTKEQLLEQIPS
jgi:hypothetical protein